MSTFKPGTEPQPNRQLQISQAAIDYLSQFPFGSRRKDMTSSERTVAQYEWTTFNNIWMYNYTVSTINGPAIQKSYGPWQYLNNKEHIAYTRGQIAHISVYSTIGNAGGFDDIRF